MCENLLTAELGQISACFLAPGIPGGDALTQVHLEALEEHVMMLIRTGPQQKISKHLKK